MLVYLAENPRALKGICKSQLPVISKANKKAWVTLAVFEDWFINHFVPSVEQYCTKKDILFKGLLVLDNAPGHPAQLGDFNPNVKVVYLPPNTTALLQPMDQGVIASFKAYFLRRTIAMALQATETMKDFWKSYNILDAVQNIAYSWEEVKVTNMNGVWRKLCPQFLNDFHGFEEIVDHVIMNIVALSKEINLYVEVDDVTELSEFHGEELSAGDLIQLEKQIIEEEETSTPEPKAFTRQGLSKGFVEIQQALATFEALDPNMERLARVFKGIMDLLQCYKEILDEKKILSVQSNMEKYFKKVERPAPFTSAASITTDPLPSTSAASTTPASPPSY